MKKLYFLTGMALICVSNILAQAFTVTATPVTSTICSNNSTAITANPSPVGYSVAAISHAPIASPGAGGTSYLADAGSALVTPTAPLLSAPNYLDDGRWDNISLPFTFNFYGTDYTDVNISTNGWMAFGSTSTSITGVNVSVPNTGSPNATVYASGADLDLRNPGGGTLEYFDGGSFPNRYFVVLWTNVKFRVATGTNVTVEIILRETTNTVEIHTSSCTNTTITKVQGIENAAGTVGTPAPGRNNIAVWTGIPNAYKFSPDQFTYAWSPSTGLNMTTGRTVISTLNASQTYNVIATRTSDNVTANSNVTITVNPASFTLANTPVAGGSSPVCQNISLNAAGSTDYRDAGTCNLIATILPSGLHPLDNSVMTCVRVDTGATKKGTSDFYGARSYDMEPISNAPTATATVTLYYLQSEFNKFNVHAVDSGQTTLPTGPADATGISNLIIRQFHGTGTKPGAYTTGTYDDLTTALAGSSVIWNGTRSWWEVKMPVNGFSGFYLTSKKSLPVPIRLEYLNGSKSGNNNLLEWKVNCTSTEAKFEIERSADGRSFTSINNFTASQVRCLQAFNFTDIHALPGFNYYRINMIDVDGKSSYSGVVVLLNKESGFDIVNIVPTLIHKETATINFNAVKKIEVTIVVTDIAGKVIRKETTGLSAGNNSIALNVDNIAAGTYQVTGYTSTGKSRTVRFVKE